MNTTIINSEEDYRVLDRLLEQYSISRIMIVHTKSYQNLSVKKTIDKLMLKYQINVTDFDDFKPNPSYESVMNGVNLSAVNNIECIIAIGGGSAIDVAKGIKYYSNNRIIKLVAIPTTAGTGSEATHFAVIYKNGIKVSVANNDLIPDVAILDADLLTTLPKYQRISTGLDALCHSVESIWAVNATDRSREYSYNALKDIIESFNGYILGDELSGYKMLLASNIAGKAINISKTTAAHAMSYRLSSIFNISHGHAATLCLMEVWKKMADTKCLVLKKKITKIDDIIKTETGVCLQEWLYNIINDNQLGISSMITDDLLDDLCDNVNVERLGNHPEKFKYEDIRGMYINILKKNVKIL